MNLELAVLGIVGTASVALAYYAFFRSDSATGTRKPLKLGIRTPKALKQSLGQVGPATMTLPDKQSKTSPVSGACVSCKAKVVMPFRCKFCGFLYCESHRLPENHSCDLL